MLAWDVSSESLCFRVSLELFSPRDDFSWNSFWPLLKVPGKGSFVVEMSCHTPVLSMHWDIWFWVKFCLGQQGLVTRISRQETPMAWFCFDGGSVSKLCKGRAKNGKFGGFNHPTKSTTKFESLFFTCLCFSKVCCALLEHHQRWNIEKSETTEKSVVLKTWGKKREKISLQMGINGHGKAKGRWWKKSPPNV